MRRVEDQGQRVSGDSSPVQPADDRADNRPRPTGDPHAEPASAAEDRAAEDRAAEDRAAEDRAAEDREGVMASVAEAAVAAVAPVVQPVVQPVVEAAERIEQTLGTEAARQTVPRWVAVRRALTFRAAAISSIAGFALLVYLVRRLEPLAWDVRITRGLQRIQAPAFARLMEIVSAPGFPPSSQIIVGSVASFLWLAGLRLEAAFACSTWGAGLFSTGVKMAMRRPRPAAPLVLVRSVVGETSFPSGHTVHYTTFYGYLLFLAYTLLRRTKLRGLMITFCGIMMALVGPSRVYQGHHWTSDVLAAYSLGLAWLLGATEWYRRLKSHPSATLPRWLRRPSPRGARSQ